MFDLNSEMVCRLIDLAREFHAKEEVVIPDEPEDSDSDWAMQVLADHASDPSYLQFKTAVDDLEPDQQVALVALMWIGRGDFDGEEWDAAFEEAGEAWTTHTADYLIATPLVADYLEEGLSQLGYSCEEA